MDDQTKPEKDSLVARLTKERDELRAFIEKSSDLQDMLDTQIEEANARTRAAESRLAELEQEAVKVVGFYADKESYRNRPIDEQRELLKGADPTISISGIGEAPRGTALSDIQMDRHGNRARAFLDKLRKP